MGSEQRVRNDKISFRVSTTEKAYIIAQANQCDMSTADYARTLTLAHQPKCTVDQHAFTALAQLNADQGRLGGLLKLWLSDPKTKHKGKSLNINTLLTDIRKLQKQIQEKAKEL